MQLSKGTRTALLGSFVSSMLWRSLLFLLVSTSPLFCLAVCINGTSYNGHCYGMFGIGGGLIRAHWFNAQFTCESLGAYLVTITDQAEQDFVMNTFPNTRFWIGGTDRGFEDAGGLFRWITDEVFSYTNWLPSNPDNAGNEDCLEIVDFPGDEGKWNDKRCIPGVALDLPYLCEWREIPKDYTDCPDGLIYHGILQDCMPCPYFTYPLNNHCYMLMGGIRYWRDHALLCEKSAGYLVTFEDAAELSWQV